MPSSQLLADIGQYNEELVTVGIGVDGADLHPPSRGARLSGTDRTVINVPFAETKDFVAGYWV